MMVFSLMPMLEALPHLDLPRDAEMGGFLQRIPVPPFFPLLPSPFLLESTQLCCLIHLLCFSIHRWVYGYSVPFLLSSDACLILLFIYFSSLFFYYSCVYGVNILFQLLSSHYFPFHLLNANCAKLKLKRALIVNLGAIQAYTSVCRDSLHFSRWGGHDAWIQDKNLSCPVPNLKVLDGRFSFFSVVAWVVQWLWSLLQIFCFWRLFKFITFWHEAFICFLPFFFSFSLRGIKSLPLLLSYRISISPLDVQVRLRKE